MMLLKGQQQNKCFIKSYTIHEFNEKGNTDELFFKSHFSYYPLVTMFHSHTIKNNINVHNRNLQMLATEMDKMYNNKAPPNLLRFLVNELRHRSFFSDPHVRSAYNETESVLIQVLKFGIFYNFKEATRRCNDDLEFCCPTEIF